MQRDNVGVSDIPQNGHLILQTSLNLVVSTYVTLGYDLQTHEEVSRTCRTFMATVSPVDFFRALNTTEKAPLPNSSSTLYWSNTTFSISYFPLRAAITTQAAAIEGLHVTCDVPYTTTKQTLHHLFRCIHRKP